MENNKTINKRTIDAITLCQLIDEYGIFHEAFMKFLEGEKDPFKTIMVLGKLSRGERCYASCYAPRKVKDFYRANKKIIDTIEQNAGMRLFVLNNYDYSYNRYKVFFKSDDFYQYLLENIDKCAAKSDISRNEFINQCIQFALKHLPDDSI